MIKPNVSMVPWAEERWVAGFPDVINKRPLIWEFHTMEDNYGRDTTDEVLADFEKCAKYDVYSAAMLECIVRSTRDANRAIRKIICTNTN